MLTWDLSGGGGWEMVMLTCGSMSGLLTTLELKEGPTLDWPNTLDGSTLALRVEPEGEMIVRSVFSVLTAWCYLLRSCWRACRSRGCLQSQ